jgi:murein DD-endopeptidase MepM/ murein hydrolase activator NlpD
MHTLRLRSFALAAAALITVSMIGSMPASASVRTADDFTLTVFPNDTTAVNFWDSWGARRSGGRRHAGIDIMAPRGTPILAVADGIVADFGTARLSGYFIRLDHGNGWSTAYMHLNNDTLGTDDGAGGEWTAFHPLLTVGSEVVAGQVIGYVGDSGNAEGTQPHTHFEVRYEGDKVNPYPLLRDAWRREMRTPEPALTPR